MVGHSRAAIGPPPLSLRGAKSEVGQTPKKAPVCVARRSSSKQRMDAAAAASLRDLRQILCPTVRGWSNCIQAEDINTVMLPRAALCVTLAALSASQVSCFSSPILARIAPSSFQPVILEGGLCRRSNGAASAVQAPSASSRRLARSGASLTRMGYVGTGIYLWSSPAVIGTAVNTAGALVIICPASQNQLSSLLPSLLSLSLSLSLSPPPSSTSYPPTHAAACTEALLPLNPSSCRDE